MPSYFIPGCNECRMNVFDSAQAIAQNLNENVKDNADVWINLTNGVEILPFLLCRIPFKFCRFRSCSFEQKNWNDAIADMPDDMLMNFALGVPQYIVDLGANRPCPRSLRQGFAIALRRISVSWGIGVDEHMWIFSRSGIPMRVSDDFARQAMRIDGKQKSRLDYFRRYLDTDKLRVNMMCAPTCHDGDYDMYSDIVKQCC